MNRTFGAKKLRKWFVLLCQKGVRKVTVFVAIFHSVYFFHGVVKLRFYCGEMCIFPVSAFSIFY